MSIGKIREFDPKSGMWSSYVDRLEMYFKANGIKEELKLPTMISAMGDEAYELLVNLASPKKPAELTFSAASDLLFKHLQPTPSVLAERYRFRQRRQLPEESIGEYVAELKKLARQCEFNDGLNENLRDQFVCGLKGEIIRQRLFAEDGNLNFVSAVKLASSLEAAERDAAAVDMRSGGAVIPGSAQVHHAAAAAPAWRAHSERRGGPRHTRNNGYEPRVSSGYRAPTTTRQSSHTSKYCKGCGSSGHQYAFKGIKNILMSSRVLAHYDPSKPLIVTCDASAVGLGGVLSQPSERGCAGDERPIAFVSRTLTKAEQNYSQIHKEALAIIFCMKKFHQYIYGRRFTLRTDHKPLVSIFGPHIGIPTMTASRMQRWAIILSAYSYDIEYVRTDANTADGLSRLPRPGDNKPVLAMPEQTYLHFVQDAMLLDCSEIKSFTAKDPILGRILGYIRDGWPTECEMLGLRPYFNRKNELYEELGCVMWGHRVVVPEKCREKVLKMLHEPHMGIVKSKTLGRSYVWWAGMDEAIEAMCRACATCAAHADAPPRQAPRPWPWPTKPWSRLHLDFLGPLFGQTYLVVVDSMSKWVEIFNVASTTATGTIAKLLELWSRWGIPRQIVTDNGPPFTSAELRQFLKDYGVEHVFTAPYHAASNGAAENAVKTLKRVIKKAHYERKDIIKSLHTFLLYYRNTPHSSTGECPASLMLGRRVRTKLDILKPDLTLRMSEVQKQQAETAGGADRLISPGESVWYRQFLKGEKWGSGKVESQIGTSNYQVRDENGNQVHRHIDQIKRKPRSSLVFPSHECRPSESNTEDPHSGFDNNESSDKSMVTLGDLEKSTLEQDTGSAVSVDNREHNTNTQPGISKLPQGHQECKGSRPIRQCRLKNPVNYKC